LVTNEEDSVETEEGATAATVL